jgi:hypothetical protein
MDPAQLQNVQALLLAHFSSLEQVIKSAQELERALLVQPKQAPLPAAVEEQSWPTKTEVGSAGRLAGTRLSEPLLSASTQPSSIAASTMPDLQKRSQKHSEFLGIALEEERSSEELRRMLSRKNKFAWKALDEYQLYHDGFAKQLILSKRFRLAQFIFIFASCIWVGIEIDFYKHLDNPHSLPCEIINNVICAVFSLEIAIRYAAFKSTRDAFFHWGFAYDAMVWMTVAWNTWVNPSLRFCSISVPIHIINLSFLRVFRLQRVAQMGHLMNYAPELMSYGTGIVEGLKATAPLLCLLCLVVYVFAVTFTYFLSDTVTSFATVAQSYHLLFISALASVDKNFFVTMLNAGWLPWSLYLMYTLIANLIVAKMLTGVLLQVVQKIVQREKDKSDTEKLEDKMKTMTQVLDSNGNGTLSDDEFGQLMKNDELIQSMREHGIDVAGFIEHTRSSIPEGGDLLVNDLIRFAKQFCTFKPATVVDLQKLTEIVSLEMEHHRNALLNTVEGLNKSRI